MTVEDKLIDQVTSDTATALKAQIDVIESVVNEHITAIDTAHEKMKDSNTKVGNYGKGLKAKLEKGASDYNSSIHRLFS